MATTASLAVRADLRARIDSLDVQTEGIGLPLSFTNALYDLRGHIHMVGKRILLRLPPGAGAGLAPAPDERAAETPDAGFGRG